MNDFKPIYGTDRATGQVELVGVMRERNTKTTDIGDYLSEVMLGSEGSGKVKVENGFFVTELQVPRG